MTLDVPIVGTCRSPFNFIFIIFKEILHIFRFIDSTYWKTLNKTIKRFLHFCSLFLKTTNNFTLKILSSSIFFSFKNKFLKTLLSDSAHFLVCVLILFLHELLLYFKVKRYF